MAILIDFNHLYLSSVFTAISMHEKNESSIRHVFLNTLLSMKKRFQDEYGDIIVCADSSNSWRKDIFPYYKANRSENRQKDGLDWDEIFSWLNAMYEDLRDIFPYKTLKINRCEADDIIAVICMKNGVFLNDGTEKFLIMSKDHDFKQLHYFSNVYQYDNTNKKYIVESNPEEALKVHIMRGDSGDGVPNILSTEDTFVAKKRQKVFTAKRMEHYSILANRLAEPEIQSRYLMNKKLVDFNEIPEDFVETIHEEYLKDKQIDRRKMKTYFVEKRLKLLAENLQDF